MTTYTSIEERLLLAAQENNLPAIRNIVSRLSTQEKQSVGTNVFDAALNCIAEYAKADAAESAYTTMVFIRAVGAYISETAVNAVLQSTQPASCAVHQMQQAG
jgi:hypothetical protein